MLKFTEKEFKEIKERGEVLYKSLDKIYCPYFKDKVTFGADGLSHLKFKRREKSRPEQDQYMRFKLIQLAPEVLRASHTLQGIFETRKFERISCHNRKDIIMKSVKYYEFIAVIKRNRIKVIVKQIEGGNKFFWSIIPFWKMNKYTMDRILYDGTPEED